MLRLENIKKSYKVAGESVPALKGVSVNFRANEFVSILGPSGCGKTTLLNIIGGLDKYTSGDLIINGRSTKEFGDRDWDVYRNHRVGFVFQSYNLIPHQTVLGNVELALTIAGVSKAERKARAKAALIKVGLGDHINKRPNQLSGGQCQRVAIARALVNDPEILLADEPTGALDTKTSVQIMDLMKEIAGERLVVMVTHNPELANEYSTRIISLRDGQVIYDTNPYASEDEAEESARRMAAEKQAKAEQLAAEKRGENKPRREKAKMGFAKAFALSGKNLMAKRGRTIMVGIAGSIGIIGVAIVLAFSSGIQGYIYDMETDMLSGYPVTISKSAVDYSQLMDMAMNLGSDDDKDHLPDKIYINSIVEAMTEMQGMTVTNTITQEYLDFLDALPKENYETMQYSYGINFANNIYTHYDFDVPGTLDSEGKPIVSHDISIAGIRATFASVLGEIEDYKAYTSMIDSIATFREVPDSQKYIESQYEVVAGKYPEQTDKSALVLVLSGKSEVDDLLLAQFGYVSAREFVNYAFDLADVEDGLFQPDQPHLNESYDYNKFVGDGAKGFTWYPNSTVFDYVPPTTEGLADRYVYNTYADEFTAEKQATGVALNVACILKPHASVNYGSLASGMYYTKALTDYVRAIETNPDTMATITKHAKAAEEKAVSNVSFTYTYYYDKVNDETGEITRNIKREIKDGFGSTSNNSLSSIATTIPRETFEQIMMGLVQAGAENNFVEAQGIIKQFSEYIYGSSDKLVYLSALGGAELPTKISIYTDDFNRKDNITAYLDQWNDFANGHITEESQKVKYTDMLGVIMTMVNTLITMITVALIVFTSISLVVSTVMIGIITFVSVVERIKEIGVIRAMGGSKRDVKNLFTAETFIIGLIAGLIGIAVTYLLSLVANIIIGSLAGISTLAALPPWQALIMVAISVLLTLISGLLPASKAAKQDPVVALRTE